MDCCGVGNIDEQSQGPFLHIDQSRTQAACRGNNKVAAAGSSNREHSGTGGRGLSICSDGAGSPAISMQSWKRIYGWKYLDTYAFQCVQY